MNLDRITHSLGSYIRRNQATIQTILGVVGVATTAILTAEATSKAIGIMRFELGYDPNTGEGEKPSAKDVVKETWKCYIPAVISGSATIVCILSANKLNKDQQTALTSAYIFLDNTYQEYRKKVEELYGEDADRVVRHSIFKEHAPEIPKVQYEETRLFYEDHHGQIFERTMAQVIDAEYQLNKIFSQNGEASLNDFLRFLDLPEVPYGDTMGWSQQCICDFYNPVWIDFSHELMEMDDGMECYYINMLTPPMVDYQFE